jgi:hypothetical protein
MAISSNAFVLRRSAKLAGWIGFASFELLVFALVSLVASVRCCGADSPAGPQSPGEWLALALFAPVMLLLGVAVGSGVAVALEGLLRLFARIAESRPDGSSS